MSIAKIDPPGTDKLKFTVGSRLGKTSSPAMYLKGNRMLRGSFACGLC